MLQRPARKQRPPSPNALRLQRLRARRKAGRTVYQIETDEHAVAQALIRSLRLSEAETQDRKRIERALADVVAEWAEHWRE
jgi:hypothetical protein